MYVLVCPKIRKSCYIRALTGERFATALLFSSALFYRADGKSSINTLRGIKKFIESRVLTGLRRLSELRELR